MDQSGNQPVIDAPPSPRYHTATEEKKISQEKKQNWVVEFFRKVGSWDRSNIRS